MRDAWRVVSISEKSFLPSKILLILSATFLYEALIISLKFKKTFAGKNGSKDIKDKNFFGRICLYDYKKPRVSIYQVEQFQNSEISKGTHLT